MASSGQTISPGALRYLKYFYFVRHWGKKVFFLVFDHLFLAGQSKTIREVLKDNGISLYSTGEHSFTSDEISKMSGNPEDLDITLMNKICWRFWNNGMEFRFKRMKSLMTKIRTERNVVSHEDCKMSETELDQKIKTFQATLEDTLNAAKSLWPNNNGVTIDKQKIGQLKTEIKDVPNFLKKIRGKYDPLFLEEEINDFWDQFYEYILQLIQEELKSLYGRLCKICFYEWLVQYGVTDPCSTTVSLKMDEQKEFHGCHKGQGCITVDQNDILDIKDPEGKDPKALLISGCAGAGKSTIMCIVLEKWYKGTTDMPSLPSFPILLYFQFRNQSDDNFDRYIQSLLPKTLGLFALEHVKSVIMSSKCLILCDGYDEANDSSRKLFEELLTLNFSDRKVVVTTRPGGTEGLTNCINKAKHDRINLSVLGLRGEDMKSLQGKITSYLMKDDATRMEEMKTELCQVIEDLNETAKVILETPLYFNLFILLYIECPAIRERVRKEKRISDSMLYIHFEEHKKDRIIEKTGMESEYLKKFDNLYLEYSMQNYKKKKYELSQTDVDDMKSRTQCKEVTDNFDSLLSSYFNIKHSIQGLRMKKIYSYRHASELEFAAARKISEDIIKSVGTKTGNIVESVLISNDVWEQLRKSKSYFPFFNSLDTESLFTFIVGILYHSERNTLYSVIDDVHKILLTLTGDYFDLVLTPCLNTISSLDGKVLDSLTLVLKSSAIDYLRIRKASSVFVLPQLIQRLEPKRVEIRCSPSVIHFPSLKEAAEVARDRTRFELFLAFDLSNITQFDSFSVDSFNVDKLHLEIDDYDERVDVNQLCPIPISSKDLSVFYWGGDERNMLEVSHIINTIWPRRQEREVFETESKGGMSSSQSHSKGNGDEFQHPMLVIGKTLRDDGIRLLLDSLNVQPLRQLQLLYFSVSNEDILAELSLECRKRGFGELAGVKVEPVFMRRELGTAEVDGSSAE